MPRLSKQKAHLATASLLAACVKSNAKRARVEASLPTGSEQLSIDSGRLTTGSGKSLPGLSHPGHGTGSGPGREGKGSSGTGPGSVPHGMGWARVTISAEGTGPVLLFHARDGTGK